MADGNKRVLSFNKGILHCGNWDKGKYGGKRVWWFIGGGGAITRFYCSYKLDGSLFIQIKLRIQSIKITTRPVLAYITHMVACM